MKSLFLIIFKNEKRKWERNINDPELDKLEANTHDRLLQNIHFFDLQCCIFLLVTSFELSRVKLYRK